MSGLIGRKIGMTQVFKEDGTVIPVTVLGFLLHLSPSQLVRAFCLTLAALALVNYAVNRRRSPPVRRWRAR